MRHFGRGHTNGDTVIFFPDLRTVHSGDLVIDGMPVIDYDNGGGALEFVTTLERMLALGFDTVIPGHRSGDARRGAEPRATRVLPT